jgi:hypothetical protein
MATMGLAVAGATTVTALTRKRSALSDPNGRR